MSRPTLRRRRSRDDDSGVDKTSREYREWKYIKDRARRGAPLTAEQKAIIGQKGGDDPGVKSMKKGAVTKSRSGYRKLFGEKDKDEDENLIKKRQIERILKTYRS